MMDVTRGLLGRRVCGSMEFAFGVLLFIGGIQDSNDNITSILSAGFIVLTGILGIVSINKGLVIAYMVTGITCAVLLAISIIFTVILMIPYIDDPTADSTVTAILIAALVILVLVFFVTLFGVYFASVPFKGNNQEQDGAEQFNYTTLDDTAEPPSCNYGNTAYPDTHQGPV